MSYAHTISDINTMTMNVVLYEKNGKEINDKDVDTIGRQ
jgi:hypothetical protein